MLRLQQALERQATAQEAADAALAAESAHLAERRASATRVEERFTEARVAAIATAEQQRATGQALERLQRQLQEDQRQVARGNEVDEHSGVELLRLREDIEVATLRRTTLLQQLEAQRSELSQARAAYDARGIDLAAREDTLRGGRRALAAAAERAGDLQLKVHEMAGQGTQLCQQVRERFGESLLDLLHAYHLRPAPTGEDTLRHRALADQIERIGPVNLLAIEECDALEERHGFLVAQRDDLQEALEALRRAIRRINRTSRQRFREAFDAVNDLFQKLFPRLFRGGEARLELLPHEDILEAGVDIVAQPPGKKLQSVSLLSGGEQALTATALVFAIFLIKPSPFCVLDEADAALDDANVGRFSDLLMEMAQIAQFIVITHNKNTMRVMDRLYGVTMQEPGLSKLVGVDLKQVERQAA
jgi:chromosome segregation protein